MSLRCVHGYIYNVKVRGGPTRGRSPNGKNDGNQAGVVGVVVVVVVVRQEEEEKKKTTNEPVS